MSTSINTTATPKHLIAMEPIPCLDKGYVALLRVTPHPSEIPEERTGDFVIVDAARISYAKGTKKPSTDQRLINYLWKHEHTSPFEMADATFCIKCPLFVARQFMRHRTWSYNEVSARYSEVEDEFHVPEVVRAQATTNRQSSEGEVDELTDRTFGGNVIRVNSKCMGYYEEALQMGVCREQARMLLPQTMYTTFYAKANLRNILHFIKLRKDPGAQEEIRVYAEAMEQLLCGHFPYTFEAFHESCRQ